MGLIGLPLELQWKVYRFLPVSALKKLARTCRVAQYATYPIIGEYGWMRLDGMARPGVGLCTRLMAKKSTFLTRTQNLAVALTQSHSPYRGCNEITEELLAVSEWLSLKKLRQISFHIYMDHSIPLMWSNFEHPLERLLISSTLWATTPDTVRTLTLFTVTRFEGSLQAYDVREYIASRTLEVGSGAVFHHYIIAVPQTRPAMEPRLITQQLYGTITSDIQESYLWYNEQKEDFKRGYHHIL